jgi:hypothetical protein
MRKKLQVFPSSTYEDPWKSGEGMRRRASQLLQVLLRPRNPSQSAVPFPMPIDVRDAADLDFKVFRERLKPYPL